MVGFLLVVAGCGGDGGGADDGGNPYTGNPGTPDTNLPEVTCADLPCDDRLNGALKHCFEGSTSLGAQNSGRIFTTFEGGVNAPLYGSKGVHSLWGDSLDQSGAVFLR